MKLAAAITVGLAGCLHGALAGQFIAHGHADWAAGTGALALICAATLFVMVRRG